MSESKFVIFLLSFLMMQIVYVFAISQKPEAPKFEMESANFNDEQIPDLPLTILFMEIRKCQILCKRSQRSTFIGSLQEFGEAHRILEQVQKESPEERQRQLIGQMRLISHKYDNTLLNRCGDFADRATGWDNYR